MIKYFLWGSGEIGQRMLKHVPDEDVVGFIDIDKNKQNKMLCGKQVISPEDFFLNYNDCYIVISTYEIKDIAEILNNRGYKKYFLCTDCPPEWLDVDERLEFTKYVKSQIKDNGKQAVMGVSLYSLYVADWITKKSGNMPDIIYDRSIHQDLVDYLRIDIKDYRFIPYSDMESVYDSVYSTEKKNNADSKLISNSIDVRNCSAEISDYWNEEIREYKNIHFGKRCFIVGTGPSLKLADLDILDKNGEICFSVNRIFNSFDKTEWRPQYYVAGDSLFLREYGNILRDYNLENIIIGDVNGNVDKISFKKVFGKRYKWIHMYREVLFNELPEFAVDLTKGLYYGWTVIYMCLQLAVYMGFKDIYLMGVDCNYVKGSRNNYFFKEKTDDNIIHYEDQMIYAYEAAREYADSHGLNIYNTTRGGMLEVFERVDFDSLLNKTEH